MATGSMFSTLVFIEDPQVPQKRTKHLVLGWVDSSDSKPESLYKPTYPEKCVLLTSVTFTNNQNLTLR